MNRYTFNVGTTYDKDNRPISARVVLLALTTIRSNLAITFGGYTEVAVQGGWINGKGDFVMEDGVQFSTVTDKPVDVALEVAAQIAATLNQESVLLTEESVNASFISQKVKA